MSVGEYLEMIRMATDGAGFHSMNALAILFAYLTAAYLAGNKLTKFQLVIATGLYSVFYFIPSFSAVNTMESVFRLGVNFRLDYPIEFARLTDMPALANVPLFVNIISLAYILAWIAGILFMISSRHTK